MMPGDITCRGKVLQNVKRRRNSATRGMSRVGGSDGLLTDKGFYLLKNAASGLGLKRAMWNRRRRRRKTTTQERMAKLTPPPLDCYSNALRVARGKTRLQGGIESWAAACLYILCCRFHRRS